MSKKHQNLGVFPKKTSRKLMTVFGFCLCLFGLLYGIFCDEIFNHFLEKTMVLRPNSETFDIWKSPPIKLTLDFYVFNWTNPEDFYNSSSKPILQELGPYRFTEIPEKVNIAWHPENASVTYKKRNRYYFDAAGSNGSLDDEFVTINTLAMVLAGKTKYWTTIPRTFIETVMKLYNHNLTLKKSIRQMLFNGFEDGLLNVGHNIPSFITNVIVPFNKFGYAYPRNNSADFLGEFNVHTGADDIKKLGKLHSWHKNNATSFYPEQCQHAHVSTGEFQVPHLKPNGTIDYFVPEYCRPITLEYDEPVEVEGVRGYKYKGGLRMMDNGSLYPENSCYCNGECVPSGVMNISSCWYGVKIFMSYPHFYKADPYYISQVEGMNPQKERHELFVKLDPNTGYLLEASAKMQSNLLVEPMPHISIFRKVPKVYFPLFWFEFKTRITPDLAKNFKLLEIFIVAGQIFGWCCFALGIILFFWYPLKDRINRNMNQNLTVFVATTKTQHSANENSTQEILKT